MRLRCARGQRIGPSQLVLRVDSKGVSLVQVADLLVGAVAYAYKVDAGLILSPNRSKAILAEQIAALVGAPRLCEPIRTRKFRVMEYR